MCGFEYWVQVYHPGRAFEHHLTFFLSLHEKKSSEDHTMRNTCQIHMYQHEKCKYMVYTFDRSLQHSIWTTYEQMAAIYMESGTPVTNPVEGVAQSCATGHDPQYADDNTDELMEEMIGWFDGEMLDIVD